MTLLLNPLSKIPDLVHRIKETKPGIGHTTYCGETIPFLTARRPNRQGLPKCSTCYRHYSTNLGNPPAENIMTHTINQRHQ